MLHKYKITFSDTSDAPARNQRNTHPLQHSLTPTNPNTQEPETGLIKSLKTPWMGNGFAYFTHSPDELFIQYVALPFPDDKTRHFLHRLNITQNRDGGLFVSHTNNNIERRDRLYKKRYLHCAHFDENGEIICLNGIVGQKTDSIYDNPDYYVKNLVTEASFVLQNAQNTIFRSEARHYNKELHDIIPQAEKTLEALQQTKRGSQPYLR